MKKSPTADLARAIDVAIAALWWRGRDGQAQVLLTRRPGNVHLPGLWEFPGGKIEPGEAPPCAASRELREEVGIEVDAAGLSPLVIHQHDYGDRVVRLHAFAAQVPGPLPVQHLGVVDHRWATLEEVALLELPAANERVLIALSRLLHA